MAYAASPNVELLVLKEKRTMLGYIAGECDILLQFPSYEDHSTKCMSSIAAKHSIVATFGYDAGSDRVLFLTTTPAHCVYVDRLRVMRYCQTLHFPKGRVFSFRSGKGWRAFRVYPECSVSPIPQLPLQLCRREASEVPCVPCVPSVAALLSDMDRVSSLSCSASHLVTPRGHFAGIQDTALYRHCPVEMNSSMDASNAAVLSLCSQWLSSLSSATDGGSMEGAGELGQQLLEERNHSWSNELNACSLLDSPGAMTHGSHCLPRARSRTACRCPERDDSDFPTLLTRNSFSSNALEVHSRDIVERPLRYLSCSLSSPWSGASNSTFVSDNWRWLPADGYTTTRGNRQLGLKRHPYLSKSSSTAVNAKLAAKRLVELLKQSYVVTKDCFGTISADVKGEVLSMFFLIADACVEQFSELPRVIHLSSPLFCFGDLRGSYGDLQWIMDIAAPLGQWSMLSTSVLFLGNYVDSGDHSVEVVLLLFALVVLCPRQMCVLRGNQEDTTANGDATMCSGRSFLQTCNFSFGPQDGPLFWQRANQVFALMPLAAVIDETIFACHGGIPLVRDGNHVSTPQCSLSRSERAVTSDVSRLEHTSSLMEDTPTESLFKSFVANTIPIHSCVFDSVKPYAADNVTVAMHRRLVRELLWNYPASSEDADLHVCVNATDKPAFCSLGFRPSMHDYEMWGPTFEFNETATLNFLSRFGFRTIIRANQVKRLGIQQQCRHRIVTVFSCSNYEGTGNRGGGCLIRRGRLKMFSWGHAHSSTFEGGGTEGVNDKADLEHMMGSYQRSKWKVRDANGGAALSHYSSSYDVAETCSSEREMNSCSSSPSPSSELSENIHSISVG